MKRLKIVVKSATFDEACGHQTGLQISVEHVPGEVSEVISRGIFHVGDILTLWVSTLPETAAVVVTPQAPPRLWKKATIWDQLQDIWSGVADWWWSIVPDLEVPDG